MFIVLGGVIVYIVAMLFLNQAPPLNKVPVIDEKRIEEHNNNFSWKQGPIDFWEGQTLADAKKLMNVGFASHQNINRCQTDDSVFIPESFHIKEKFQNCMLPTENMTNQCGASYAFTLAQTMAERLCIHKNADKPTPLSAQELLKCDIMNNGCKSGHLNIGLDHMRTKGLMESDCLPYKPEAEKCEEGMCDNPTRQRLDQYCLLIGEDDIKRDILKSGAAVSTSQIYTDFLSYKSGIYLKEDEVARFSGQTALRIVGWGVESGMDNELNKGTKYWIVQNTWGKNWGEDGYAKISVGQDLFFDQYAYSLKFRSTMERPFRTDSAVDEAQTEEGITEEHSVNLDLDDITREEVNEGDI